MDAGTAGLFWAIAWLAMAGLLAYALRSFLRERRLIEQSAGATATVVGFVERPGTRGSLQHPVLRFTTAAGAEIEAENAIGARPTPYREGQTLRVLYDPAMPEAARIHAGWELHLESLVAGCMGLVAFALGLAFALMFLLLRAISRPVP